MIKNIIFDVGDVLLEYRWHQMLMDHGLSSEEAERIGTTMFQDQLWRGLDTADQSEQEIISKYREKYPEDADVIEWFIMHGEYMHVPRPEIWQQVHRLKKKGYRIYLLSNYSENLFRKHTQGADFLEDLDGKVVSYQIHKVKPDPAIYRYLLETYHLQPEECLFFDDRAENVEAAKKLGMQSEIVVSRQGLRERLEKI